MRLSVALTVSMLLFTGFSNADTAKIVAWNVSANFHTVDEDVRNNIAEGIALMDPDVIALTEVRDEAFMKNLVERLDSKHDLQYEFIFEEQNPRLHIGVLHKSNVVVEDSFLVPSTDLGESGHRQALAAVMKIENFDFVLVTVHLKSAGGSAEKKARRHQMRVLSGYVAGVTNRLLKKSTFGSQH